MKTAVYMRQSLDRDRNQLAIDRQREDLLKLCATKKGWDDPIEYCDDNISEESVSYGASLAQPERCGAEASMPPRRDEFPGS
jgi:hypothetical protein